MNDGLEPRLAEDVNAAGVLLEAIGAQPQLIGRLLTGDVKGRDALALESRGALHQEGGFADAGLAADEHDRARDDAATEDEVEFRETGFPTRDCGTTHVGQSDGLTVGRSLGPTVRPSDRPT